MKPRPWSWFVLFWKEKQSPVGEDRQQTFKGERARDRQIVRSKNDCGDFRTKIQHRKRPMDNFLPKYLPKNLGRILFIQNKLVCSIAYPTNEFPIH